MVTVKYFASLQERLGKAEEQIDIAQNQTVADIWLALHGEAIPTGTLVSINQEYATVTDVVQASDEVAFFPPVTGG